MTKTIRLTIDVDVSVFSDSIIETMVQNVKTDVLPFVADTFQSNEIALPATGCVEVVTKYE